LSDGDHGVVCRSKAEIRSMRRSRSTGGQASLFVLLVLICLAVGVIVATYGAPRAVGLVGALVIFTVAFISPVAALYMLIFSMLLSPEITVGATGAASLGRGITLRLDDFLMVIIGFSWFVRTAIHKELGLVIRTSINRHIFFYIIVTAVATALGMMAGRVEIKTGFFFVLKYFEFFVIYFMVANYLSSEKQVRNFLIAILITAAIVSLNALRQIPGGGRISAPFEGESGEPNTFGGYLMLIMAITMALVFTRNSVSPRAKAVLLILGLLLFASLLFTLSRSSWVAIIPTYLVFMLFSDWRRQLVTILVVFLIVGPLIMPDAVRKRVKYTFSKHYSSVHIGKLSFDSSTSARLKSWKYALKDFARKPVLGYGVTGYKFIDAQYFRVLVESGLVGMVAFLWLLLSVLKFGLSHYKLEVRPLRRALYLGLIAGLVAMMAHSIGANTFIIVRIMEPFWFYAAMVISLPGLDEIDSGETVPAPEAERLAFRGV